MTDFIHSSYKILAVSGNAASIEAAGRVCYKSEPKGKPGKFVKMIIKRGHLSVLEHSFLSVRFIVDRGVSHELVRHRLASFSQESTRYCNYGNKPMKFIIPASISDEDCLIAWRTACGMAETAYCSLLAQGCRPEQARAVLPTALATTIVMSANFREWRHIFGLRCNPDAHPDMRAIMIPLLHKMKELLPDIFGDIDH